MFPHLVLSNCLLCRKHTCNKKNSNDLFIGEIRSSVEQTLREDHRRNQLKQFVKYDQFENKYFCLVELSL